MEVAIEKTISNLIAQQFPDFYQDEGPVFVQFVQAYYAWLEQTSDATGTTPKAGNVMYYNRRLMDNFDIDKTLPEFLNHFQEKYLYGIPFEIIVNPRYLIKHVLDAYRSKGSIQCFKLLFRLTYGQDCDIYLPGVDLFKTSDGTWIQPRYLEISDSVYNAKFVGKKIVGISSGTTAVVEAVIRMPLSSGIINVIYISNISPRGGNFQVTETILEQDLIGTTAFTTLSTASPVVIGSLDHLDIINGGSSMNIGDLLGAAHFDANNAVISNGVGGKVKVTGTGSGNGQLTFQITDFGYGLSQSANIFIYANSTDTSATGASFGLAPMASAQTFTYNTDVLCNYANTVINATAYSFPGNNAANLTNANLNQIFQYANDTFGSLSSLTGIRTGLGYTKNPKIFVRNVIPSQNMYGNVSYNTASANVTGTGTNFTAFYANDDCVIIQANSSIANTVEYHVIKQVANDTILVLYDKPLANSTASAKYKVAPPVFVSNWTPQDAQMTPTGDGLLNGLNGLVIGRPSFGNGVVTSATAIESGKGYLEGETIFLYPSEVLAAPTISATGTKYTNNDPVAVIGGNPYKQASGKVVTFANGTINTITWSGGSGYQWVPKIYVSSNTGSGAVLSTTIVPFDTSIQVQAVVRKGGIGVQRGYWSTTRSFLDDNKVLQDSYFWQEFSYQIQATVTLNKYRDILYETFHPAGSEMFGKYRGFGQVQSTASVGYSNSTPVLS